MLHRALATLLCLLGAAAIGLGIASATLWRASDTLLASAQAAPGTTLLMTDPGVLDLAADEVTVRASAGEGQTVVVAVGRTADVEAWVGSDPVTRVTGLSDLETLSTEEGLVEPAPAPTEEAPTEEAPAQEAPTEEAPAEEAPADQPAPDPAGSDLWVVERTGSGEATLEWPDQEGRWSVLVATTGEEAGPPSVSLAWPQVVTTPWLVPGVAAGSALLLAGALWWVLLLVRQRRSGAAVALGAGSSTARVPAAAQGPAGAAAPPVSSSPTAPALAPSPTGGAPTSPDPTSGAAPAGAAPGAVPGPALTRRQLREAEQQREREKRERETVRGRFPLRIAGPARDADAGAQPTAGGAVGPDAPPQQGAQAPAAQETSLPAPGALRSGPSASGPSASGPAPAAEPTGGRPWTQRLTGRLPGRGRTDAVTSPPPPGPAPEPAPAPGAANRPPVPSASADAWRRAWGFPSSGAEEDTTSTWPPGAQDQRPGTETSDTEGGKQR